MNNISAQIRDFIVENFLFGNDEDLNDDSSFLDEGIIDSTGVLELVAFIEENFSTRIADDELIPENLDSISNIAKFILSKTNSQTKTHHLEETAH